MTEPNPLLSQLSDAEFRAEAIRREQAAEQAADRQRKLEYDERQAEYHAANIVKANELGISVQQLEEAMDYADEVRDERW